MDLNVAIDEDGDQGSQGGSQAGSWQSGLPDVDDQSVSQVSAGLQTPTSDTNARQLKSLAKDTKSFAELLRELCATVDSNIPPARAERTDVIWRMARLPSQVPVMVPHDSLPVVTAAAQLTGAILEEQSAISMAEHNLTEQICSILAHRNTWLLFDLADVTDFNELVDFVQHCRPKRAQDPAF